MERLSCKSSQNRDSTYGLSSPILNKFYSRSVPRRRLATTNQNPQTINHVRPTFSLWQSCLNYRRLARHRRGYRSTFVAAGAKVVFSYQKASAQAEALAAECGAANCHAISSNLNDPGVCARAGCRSGEALWQDRYSRRQSRSLAGRRRSHRENDGSAMALDALDQSRCRVRFGQTYGRADEIAAAKWRRRGTLC